MGAEKWKFLQDEPCAQVISYEGDRIPSFLPKCRVDEEEYNSSNEEEHKSSNEDEHSSSNEEEYSFFDEEEHSSSYEEEIKVLVEEATSSRKAECIVITWSLIIPNSLCEGHHVRLRVWRGFKVTVECNIPLSEGYLNPTIYCVTLRKKHPVVEAVEPGDRLEVLFCTHGIVGCPISRREANVCVVYDEGGHLLLEVNSELLSRGESRKLEEQFGELVLKYENHDKNQDENSRESRRKRGVCRSLGFTFPARKRCANLRRDTSNK